LVVKDAPLDLRQREQWQFTNISNGGETS